MDLDKKYPIVTAGGDDPPGPPQVAQDPGGGHLPHLEPGHHCRAPRRPLLQTVQSGEVGGGGSCETKPIKIPSCFSDVDEKKIYSCILIFPDGLPGQSHLDYM